MGDKVLTMLNKDKINIKTNVSTTSGLVQDIDHIFLPSILPIYTFILSFIFMMVF